MSDPFDKDGPSSLEIDTRADSFQTQVEEHIGRASSLAAARADFEKARLALEMDKPVVAMRLLESCLKVEPDHPEYLGLWGYTQALVGGNLQKAIEACNRAVQSRSYDGTLHSYRGVVLRARGDLDGARTSFETALQHDPVNALATTQLEELTHRPGRWTAWLRRLLHR